MLKLVSAASFLTHSKVLGLVGKPLGSFKGGLVACEDVAKGRSGNFPREQSVLLVNALVENG